MIKDVEMFSVYCDNCGMTYIDDYNGFCAWTDESIAEDQIQDSEGWQSAPDGKHYCDKCFKGFDDNDNLVIDTERKDRHKVKELESQPSPIEQKALEEVLRMLKDPSCETTSVIWFIKHALSQSSPIEGVEREWISVKDRLPDDASRVLIFGCVKKYGVYAGAYFNFYSGGKWKSLGFEATDVTHWMPLPPPPKNG